jgi:hypothetical protein
VHEFTNQTASSDISPDRIGSEHVTVA